jgi:hypothetical protein
MPLSGQFTCIAGRSLSVRCNFILAKFSGQWPGRVGRERLCPLPQRRDGKRLENWPGQNFYLTQLRPRALSKKKEKLGRVPYATPCKRNVFIKNDSTFAHFFKHQEILPHMYDFVPSVCFNSAERLSKLFTVPAGLVEAASLSSSIPYSFHRYTSLYKFL